MPKQQELSNFATSRKNRSNDIKSDPFYIIYNHRKTLRTKALKKLKHQKRKFERNLVFVEKQTQKQEHLKIWNQSMLEQDQVWENYFYETMNKQVKQQDSTITRKPEFNDGITKCKITMVYNFPLTNKIGLFADKFISFEECSLIYQQKSKEEFSS